MQYQYFAEVPMAYCQKHTCKTSNIIRNEETTKETTNYMIRQMLYLDHQSTNPWA